MLRPFVTLLRRATEPDRPPGVAEDRSTETVMEYRTERAAVTVDQADEAWTVSVSENGRVERRDFSSEDEAKDFAHAQRLRLGLVPQPDMS